MIRYIIVLFFAICILGCEDNSLPVIKVNSSNSSNEKRLGESNYYIQLPDNFELSEARGKEGQLGYNIIPPDGSSSMFALIEIARGAPINGGYSPSSNKEDVFVKSFLLNEEVKWTITRTETGRFEAYTTQGGDLNAHISSKERNEIDSLISIIATLKQK